MEVLYRPGFASDDCAQFAAWFMLVFVGAGAVAALAVHRLVPARPNRRLMLLAAFGVPVIIGVYAVGGSYAADRESMVQVSVGGGELEHRYCRRLELFVDRYSLADLRYGDHRLEIERRSRRPDRRTHHLDLYMTGRTQPISISLDATAEEVDLELAERLAPEAVADYRAVTR